MIVSRDIISFLAVDYLKSSSGVSIRLVFDNIPDLTDLSDSSRLLSRLLFFF